MKPQMRRILAYVIARLVADTESRTLYDYQESTYFNFNGEFIKNSIRVLDFSDSTYLKGSQEKVGNTFTLKLNFADGSLAKVTIQPSEKNESESVFTGTGRVQTMKFHGTAEKNGRVSFYDSSTGMYYKLKI